MTFKFNPFTDKLDLVGPGAGSQPVTSLTGNTGGPVPPTAGNINTIGSGSITVDGNPGTSTLTAHLTGLTPFSLLAGNTTSTIANLGVAANGQLPIGSSGTFPVLATITPGTGISITNGAGSITIAAGATVPLTFAGNTGTAQAAANTINLVGTGSLTTTASGSTVTTGFTGLTAHNVLLGEGTSTLGLVAPSATTGVPLISQGAASDPVFGTALIAGGGTAATSFNINGAVFSGTTTTSALAAATLTSGQLLIGGTTTPAAATLTAGTGITIANGNNSITISAGGGGFTWNDVTGGSATMAAENGYIADSGSLTTFTMPTNNSFGDTIHVVGKGAGGWKIVYGLLQNIIFGSSATTATTGSLASTNANDCVTLVCTTASITAPIFTVINSVGNITVV